MKAAREEAESRWPKGARNVSDPLPTDWLNEGMASGFTLGAMWAADQIRKAILDERAQFMRATGAVRDDTITRAMLDCAGLTQIVKTGREE